MRFIFYLFFFFRLLLFCLFVCSLRMKTKSAVVTFGNKTNKQSRKTNFFLFLVEFLSYFVWKQEEEHKHTETI